jgi:hypothetical protein
MLGINMLIDYPILFFNILKYSGNYTQAYHLL